MIAVKYKSAAYPYPLLGISLVYLAKMCYFLPGYLNWDLNLYAGLFLAPLIFQFRAQQFSTRYFFPAVASLILAICLPVNTTFFIALLLAVLLFVESNFGKITESFLFLLFLISPVFRYLISTVDFSIRLWLTETVAMLLNGLGIQATAVGNQIEMEKYTFAVDPVCAGLNMLIISLILCLFLIVQFQKRSSRSLNFFWTGSVFLLTIALNICGNFFRILILVMFKIMPDTLFHEAVGIVCLLIYVVVPLIAGLKLMQSAHQTILQKTESTSVTLFQNLRQPCMQVFILASLIYAGSRIVKADSLVPVNNQIRLKGFSKKILSTGISKFEAHDALIYIKPAPFYMPGHDPKICWTGSGYEFKQIRKEKIADAVIYTAILTKGKDQIFTAWWFDDGEIRTVEQLSWRWKGATGEDPYYLINVNALSKQKLNVQVASLLSNHDFLKNHKL
ncbi:MAG: exosortase N [Pedobacter sp.]|nr:MAG: exosortase N [Pedobacter sp.]